MQYIINIILCHAIHNKHAIYNIMQYTINILFYVIFKLLNLYVSHISTMK